jgi:DNA-binding transcriptional ArsR family regulator
MDFDRLFRALADPTRRRMLDELAERDGQTLFELHVRLISWHGASLSRQALSKHLQVLEEAGLLRTEWRWRSKHHFLERSPLRQMWDVWMRPLAEPPEKERADADQDRRDECAGR